MQAHRANTPRPPAALAPAVFFTPLTLSPVSGTLCDAGHGPVHGLAVPGPCNNIYIRTAETQLLVLLLLVKDSCLYDTEV